METVFCQSRKIRRNKSLILFGVIVFVITCHLYLNSNQNAPTSKSVMHVHTVIPSTTSTTPVFDYKKVCSKPINKTLIARFPAVKGIYMQNTPEKRPLINFLLRPSKIEAGIKYGACNNHPDTTRWNMVYLVKSAAKNRDRRDAIRQTWGAVKVFDNIIFQVVFILGTSEDESITKEIRKESETHGDILLCDENDSAQFVPEKVLAGMQWSAEVLSHNWLYASIDDDIIVNPANLVDYFNKLIANHTSSTGGISFDDVPIACVYNYQSKDPPARNSNSKWYMPLEKYPGEFWPVYCRGGMYTASSKMVKDLFEKSRRTAHLYLDDVWITGFMRRKLNMGDCNIVAPPMSIMSEEETQKDHNISTLLVKHLWGNIVGKKVDIPKEIINVWNSLKVTLKTRIKC